MPIGRTISGVMRCVIRTMTEEFGSALRISLNENITFSAILDHTQVS